MTTRRFCKATSVFCLTTARLAPWPERKASFSRLKLDTCACGGESSEAVWRPQAQAVSGHGPAPAAGVY